ncbi:Arylsulfatase [Pontiella desulfatans]|uniref:Arylsulfatase n=2 Tax=Pontiella desulfatans TaxID=2750659 RepID=A0A6C2U2L9_PONDE|nr:sulfatase S1_9 [Kiritimatiellales bacterium]VGO13626.1 Arylsulfatase [Pontiella desulfatans]
MKRRRFTTTAAAGGGVLMMPSLRAATGSEKKLSGQPNIILIYTDQQHANMMSCAGNKTLKTPAMDYLADNGMRFTRAYTTNPVCVPARISMMTGRFPSDFRDQKGNLVRENSGGAKRFGGASEEVINTLLPITMKEAGYDLFYGGKVHLPEVLSPAKHGFKVYEKNPKMPLAEASSKIIRERKPDDKPFLMWANFISPHDICYMALRDYRFEDRAKPPKKKGLEETDLVALMNRSAKIDADEFLEKHCPPLPPNFAPQEGEPAAIDAYLRIRAFKEEARKNYTEADWRLHRWLYARLTEQVDAEIQLIIDALKESGQEENTLVIFTSDHGDMDGAHRIEHKTALYEESANVPFIAMYKGTIPAGTVNVDALVSTGLDFLPTAADYAGNPAAKADPRGRSMRPLFEGRNVEWRDTLGVESQIGWMVVNSDGKKLIEYDYPYNGKTETQMLDLKADPYETRHFLPEGDRKAAWDSLEKALNEWFPEGHRRMVGEVK